ncbi:hypothetical protein SWPG_00151 [Synechococcus phage S-CBM2]|nr:hypothetical protein SWPG_00151 [Synechococcus phage S-CBM2]
MKFNVIDREELYSCSEINPSIEIVEHRPTQYFRYYTIDNFLKTPEKFIEKLQQFPALTGLTYGARQQFTPIELRNLILAYCEVGNAIGLELNPRNWITSSNIMWDKMETKNEDWKPHNDYDVVAMLWLTNTEGGTSFYNFHDCPCFKKLENQQLMKLREENLSRSGCAPWKTFDGDDDWKLYHVAETKFNQVIIYNGDYFHSPYPKFDDSYRYNLVSFYQNFENDPTLRV